MATSDTLPKELRDKVEKEAIIIPGKLGWNGTPDDWGSEPNDIRKAFIQGAEFMHSLLNPAVPLSPAGQSGEGEKRKRVIEQDDTTLYDNILSEPKVTAKEILQMHLRDLEIDPKVHGAILSAMNEYASREVLDYAKQEPEPSQEAKEAAEKAATEWMDKKWYGVLHHNHPDFKLAVEAFLAGSSWQSSQVSGVWITADKPPKELMARYYCKIFDRTMTEHPDGIYKDTRIIGLNGEWQTNGKVVAWLDETKNKK